MIVRWTHVVRRARTSNARCAHDHRTFLLEPSRLRVLRSLRTTHVHRTIIVRFFLRSLRTRRSGRKSTVRLQKTLNRELNCRPHER